MCGRYTLTRRQMEVAESFGVKQVTLDFGPRYNIAPSHTVPVVLNQDGGFVLEPMKWGLVPGWVKDLTQWKPLINARAETLAEKPSFKQSLVRRPCLVPADGFFEWRKEGKTKIPTYIRRKDHNLLAFAGIYDQWRNSDGEVMRTFAIITTGANETMRPIHERMPAILEPAAQLKWLDLAKRQVENLIPLLVPCSDDLLETFAVSSAVNSPTQDSPLLIEPVGPPL